MKFLKKYKIYERNNLSIDEYIDVFKDELINFIDDSILEIEKDDNYNFLVNINTYNRIPKFKNMENIKTFYKNEFSYLNSLTQILNNLKVKFPNLIESFIEIKINLISIKYSLSSSKEEYDIFELVNNKLIKLKEDKIKSFFKKGIVKSIKYYRDEGYTFRDIIKIKMDPKKVGFPEILSKRSLEEEDEILNLIKNIFEDDKHFELKSYCFNDREVYFEILIRHPYRSINLLSAWGDD